MLAAYKLPQTKSGHCLLILNYDKHCTEDETNCLLLIRIIVLGIPLNGVSRTIILTVNSEVDIMLYTCTR